MRILRRVCRRTEASIMRPHPDLATSPRRTRLGNRLRRVRKFLEGRARLRPGHCGRDKARPSRPSTFDFRPSTFLAFPCCEAAFPICRQMAISHATRVMTHEACFDAAADTAQNARAHPRQFSCLGAIAPIVENSVSLCLCVSRGCNQRRGGLRVKRHLRFWSRGEAYAMPMRGDAV